MMLNKEPLVGDSLKGLEVVDELQRLGISYHFQMEINQMLEIINERFNNGEEGLEWNNNKSLYATSLHFRILRQHGYHIPQDVFKQFKNEIENLTCNCKDKAKEMLSFYEASFLAMEDESFMDEQRQFAIQHLSKYLKSNNNDQIICTKIRHALQLPFHWRMSRLEARWFIDNVYRTKPNSKSVLLDLAKLDFNIVQSIHQDDLKDVSSTEYFLEEAKRGEVANSIQCLMNDTGVSEQEARLYIEDLIVESWKKLNDEVQTWNNSPLLSKGFIEIVLNVARISHTVYEHRDGHTVEDHETKDRVLSLFIKPA
uniref:Terpene synthase N-terminal domain-containing protein n=1 Tax=Cucumis sativus TaxID=3659 RepID=A0A0A0LMW4_CUCSA